MRPLPLSVMAVVLSMAVGAPLAAAPAQSMADLARRVKAGTEVDVIDRTGASFHGRLVRADGEGVLLAPLGSAEGRRFSADDVMTVSRRGDPLWNGAAIGGGVGLLFGLALANAEGDGEQACYDAGCKTFVTAATAGLFGGIGVLFDLMIKGHQVVYKAKAARVSWSVTPYPMSRGAGLRLSARF
jgi:hypothetical protein